MSAIVPVPHATSRIAFDTIVFWMLLVLLAAIVVVSGPILTSDGPAHLSMAYFMTRAGDPAWPMLNRLYELNLSPSPNALGHLIMAGLMLILPPLVSEQITQMLCLLSVPLAARLLLRRVTPKAGWIALFFFPVALQRMFFLGLYNYCLSVTGCILCIWAYLRLRERTSMANGATLAALLFATLACQASGWLEAIVGIGAMALADVWSESRTGERTRSLFCLPVAVLASFLPAAVLFGLFALGGSGDRHITYGISALSRVTEILRGDPFAPIGRSTALAALVVELTLIGLAVSGGIGRWIAPRQTARRLQMAIWMLPISFLGFALIMPDEAGGGWTHSWRAEPFPYIGLAIACAVLPAGRLVRTVAIVVTTAGSLVMMGAMFWVQVRELPPAVREFNEADAWIGPHCTVAPILTQFKLDPANTAQLLYHPLFHLTSRFELRDDRPVLFSYVARLPVYPVRFRPGTDPQRLLFGWQPGQRDTRVRQIDIPGYEAASGIPVDYVLLGDFPEPDQVGPYQDIRAALARARYKLVHRSSGGRMELYQRPGPGGCAKP
jgi:hypothetical protein